MGGRTPKMLLPLRGKPILYWTLKFLEKCSAIQNIVLAVPPGLENFLRKKIRAWRFEKVHALISGGKERTDSTRNALKSVPEGARWVGIHDAARPFVSGALLGRLFREARRTGCAVPAVPSKDTVKISRAGGKFVKDTIPRDLCWLAQTPQVFRRDIAEKLHSKPRSASFTDDASIAESLGYKIALVMGSYDNIKVTVPEDLPLAERILRKRLKGA